MGVCMHDVVPNVLTGEGVRVGFESMKYVVSETERDVQVCLTISEPVNEDLAFLLHTEQKSAHGMVQKFL